MEKVVHITVNKGNPNMEMTAPEPTGRQVLKGQDELIEAPELHNNSAVSVAVAGVGGAGINLSRMLAGAKNVAEVKFFDTSSTNIRPGEKVKILANGSGSGSNRAENARELEAAIPLLTPEDLNPTDVLIVVFSLAGGSGSTAGPLMIRHYADQGIRVVGVAIADTSSSIGAKNTMNTLKTLSAITKNNNIYLPMIIVSNDLAETRGEVDKTAATLMTALIGMLTTSVYEVDRNDRLNWLNPKKVVDTTSGIKLMSFSCEGMQISDKVVLGNDSKEMVDSLLVLQKTPDDKIAHPLPLARLKKIGFYVNDFPNIVGKVSSDINSVNSVVDNVEKMFKTTASQKHSTVDRLAVDGGDDLVL
jgi:hypothetical protein